MGDWFGQLLGIVAAALGIVSTPDVTALGLAVALITVGVLALALTLSAPPTHRGGAPHPLRAIDVSALLAQSDPDAASHPRPRAPGVATAA